MLPPWPCKCPWTRSKSFPYQISTSFKKFTSLVRTLIPGYFEKSQYGRPPWDWRAEVLSEEIIFKIVAPSLSSQNSSSNCPGDKTDNSHYLFQRRYKAQVGGLHKIRVPSWVRGNIPGQRDRPSRKLPVRDCALPTPRRCRWQWVLPISSPPNGPSRSLSERGNNEKIRPRTGISYRRGGSLIPRRWSFSGRRWEGNDETRGGGFILKVLVDGHSLRLLLLLHCHVSDCWVRFPQELPQQRRRPLRKSQDTSA